MLLKRKLVKILEDYNMRETTGIIRQDFIIHFTDKLKWPRLNYFLKRDKFYNKIDHALDDCISYGHINCDIKNLIKVTEKGRDFIKWDGFLEEFLKRRKRLHRGLLTILSSATAGAIITWLLTYWLLKIEC